MLFVRDMIDGKSEDIVKIWLNDSEGLNTPHGNNLKTSQRPFLLTFENQKRLRHYDLGVQICTQNSSPRYFDYGILFSILLK